MSVGHPVGVAFSRLVSYVTERLSGYVLGTDPRLSDARTPTAHGHPIGDISDFDPNDYVEDGDPRLTDARTPTSHTHPVSQITDFDPSDYVLGTDSRLTDARTPTSHGHSIGEISGFDPDDYFLRSGGTISGAIEYSSNFFEFIKSSGGTGIDWQINDERRALIYLDEGHDDLRLRKFAADGALGAELILYDGAGGGITANRPIDVPDPTGNGHTLNRGYADSRYLGKSGLQTLDGALEVEGELTASDLTLDDPDDASNPTILFKRGGVENGAIVGVTSRLFLKHNNNEVNLRDGYTTFSDRIETPRIALDGGSSGSSAIEFSDGPSIWSDANGPKVQKSAAQRLLDLYEFGNQVVFRLHAATGGTTKRTRFQLDNPDGKSLTLSKAIGGVSYEVVMPPGLPVAGQKLVVDTIGSSTIVMKWES